MYPVGYYQMDKAAYYRKREEALRRCDEQKAAAERAAAYLSQLEEKQKRERMGMNEHIENVIELQQGVASMYREVIVNQMEAEISRIRADQNLSEMGKAAKMKEVRDRYRRDLYKFAKINFERQQAELEMAIKKARAVLDRPTPRPDDLTIERFKRSLADLKTEILLKPGRAAEKISAFAGNVNDPYLAELLRDELPGLIASAGSLSTDDRLQLSQAAESLQTRLLTPEQREAVETIQRAEALRGNKMFNLSLQNHIAQTFGRDVASKINDAEAVAAEAAATVAEGESE